MSSGRAAAHALLLAGAFAVALVTLRAQTPTFRASVDVIVADVQVVDGQGRPVPGLTADKFEASIDGRRHRVLTVDFIQVGAAEPVAAPIASAPATVAVPTPPTAAPSSVTPGRLFVIAVDTLSFTPAQSAGVMRATRAFLDRLQPQDRVGLFAYPMGPKLDPSTDHAAIAKALDSVMGARMTQLTGRFQLRPSEIVDIAAADRSARSDPSTTAVTARECGGDGNCIKSLIEEVQAAVGLLESLAVQGLGGLRALIQALGSVPERKTVVLVTAGMIASDRPGGRPDVTELAMLAGQDAARANVTVYTVFVDQTAISHFSAERRSGASNRFTSHARDSDVLGRWFDQFSGTAGGTMITDLIGNGEFGFDRVIRETSAYYRLGIEPTDAIRDGRPHQIRIRVDARRATVRGRSWVIVPPK